MMLWVIWDILVPLAIAFLAGLLFGWLLWRWRRLQITSTELATIRRSSARYKSDADMLRNRNAEMAERLRASNGVPDSTALQDLAAANKRIDKLREQLKTSDRELAAHKRLEPRSEGDPGVRTGTTRLHVSSAGRVQDLEAKLLAARQQIRVLESSASQAQGGSAGTGYADPRQAKDIVALEEAIAARDEMIETLKHSLEQYGAQQDTTALLAEIELKEDRIVVLENLLNDAQRVA